ncbi:MAG: cyclic pyranopterin monophosphate synthase accessory protein [Cyclobacteriaceae bacterium]|nr:MAG: cyclic pyranopterin monophosphate synthase accessory protein [Cyclobacteriaceae bacterium]
MDSEKRFSHVDSQGNPTMVDVSHKSLTSRSATAKSIVVLGQEIMERLKQDEIHTKKGPVFQTAITAGIMAVKKTSELIPLCHPLPIENCKITVVAEGLAVEVTCTVSLTGKTGVEMEALTGASVASLTIYDMCKAFSHDIVIKETRLHKKTGGKNDFSRE